METNITGYERALALIAQCKSSKSTTLDLGNLGLTEVPEELWECVWLKRLNFGDFLYYASENERWILSKNKGEENQLSVIPPAFNRLSHLMILSFNENQIAKIENLDNS